MCLFLWFWYDEIECDAFLWLVTITIWRFCIYISIQLFQWWKICEMIVILTFFKQNVRKCASNNIFCCMNRITAHKIILMKRKIESEELKLKKNESKRLESRKSVDGKWRRKIASYRDQNHNNHRMVYGWRRDARKSFNVNYEQMKHVFIYEHQDLIYIAMLVTATAHLHLTTILLFFLLSLEWIYLFDWY